MEKKEIDVVNFELIRNALSSIIEIMALVMQRTSYSHMIREHFDFATGLCDAKGNTLAEGQVAPMHAGVFPSFIKTVLKLWDGRIFPGDVFICNDPYEGASHLPDIFTVAPIFVDDKLVAFSGAIAHQLDVGGKTPGSNACDNTEIFQEGLRIPPLKFYERGEPNFTLKRVIEKNVRVPNLVIGDLEAQVAASRVGEREFSKLVKKYGGWDPFSRYLDELLDYSERLTRAAIQKLPQGDFDFEDYMDDDGFSGSPVRFYVKITVKGDLITFDYTGSSPTVKGSINNPLTTTVAVANAALRLLLDPSIPANSGVYRALTIIAPYGTVLNAAYPAGVAGRGATISRQWDVTTGALAKIVPEIGPATSTSLDIALCMGGPKGRNEKPFVYFESLPGSWAGRPFADGIDSNTPMWANASNVPCEVTEREQPLTVVRYGFIPDSGGPGKHRGGLSVVKEYRIDADDVVVQWRQDRSKFAAQGIHGGKPGGLAHGYHASSDGKTRELKKETFFTRKGDFLRAITPGAGGWGSPFEREPEKVLRDVLNEKVSVEAAKRDYGVVIDPLSMRVDPRATKKTRLGHPEATAPAK